MSIKNKVNFKKGWPSPTIVEAVANVASGNTALQAGMIGHLNSSGEWVLGMLGTGGAATEINATPYIFHNDYLDGDTGNYSPDATISNPAKYGGVHGISLHQPLVIETSQIASGYTTPVIGNKLMALTSGKVDLATSGNRVIGYVTEAKHDYNGLTYLTFVPEFGNVVV